MRRHAALAAYTDAASLAPDRVPAHRAPKHRNDRHEDSCSLACNAGLDGGHDATAVLASWLRTHGRQLEALAFGGAQ